MMTDDSTGTTNRPVTSVADSGARNSETAGSIPPLGPISEEEKTRVELLQDFLKQENEA